MTLVHQWTTFSKNWFHISSTLDRHLYDTYHTETEQRIASLLNGELTIDPSSVETDIDDHLFNDILLLDQLPRHFKRICPDIYTDTYILSITTELVSILLKHKSIEAWTSGIEQNPSVLWKWIFTFLPFRHFRDQKTSHKNAEYIRPIYEWTLKHLSIHPGNPLLLRFWTATLKDWVISNQSTCITLPECLDSFEEVIDKRSYVKTNDNPKSEKMCCKHLNSPSVRMCLQHLNREFSHLPERPECIIISLSGGVDSNVLALLLKEYTRQYNIPYGAVHINYNNVDVAKKEMAFVVDYAKKIDIPCYVREIDEIHRKVVPNGIPTGKYRAVYEHITKCIRMNTYKEVAKKLTGKKDIHPYVFLGHHGDDIQENIISNIKKGNWANLSGMNVFTPLRDYSLTLSRPLLSIVKEDILDMAHTQGIPYLLDRTSIHCERGKLRSTLIPTINNYDRNMASRMKELSDVLNSLKSISHRFLDKCIGEYHYRKRLVWSILLEDARTFDHNLWSELIFRSNTRREELTKTPHTGYPSRKSVHYLEQRMKQGIKSHTKIHLNATTIFLITDKEVLLYI